MAENAEESRRFMTTLSRAKADIFDTQNDSTQGLRGVGDNPWCTARAIPPPPS